MARKQVERSLPPVEKTFVAFAGFDPKTSRQGVILHELRVAAKKLRGTTSRPFYAMRDIAQYFEVPLRTVAVAYEELELEGLLNRIRGSKTLLIGKTISPRKPVRAVVGIPLWLHSIVVSPYTRLLHVELEERLRRCGFVADIIFFRDNERSKPEFAERLLQHKLDFVIWHTPHASDAQVLLFLKDSGVQQILIQTVENPISLALPSYFLNWQVGYQAMMDNWLAQGIKTVLLPEPAYVRSQKAMHGFASMLTNCGLDVRFIKGQPVALRNAALKLRGDSTVVAFLDQLGADAFCNEEPVLIEEILKHCRLAFCRGPLRIPYFRHRDAAADVVGFSAHETAERIVNDLRDGHILGDGRNNVFEAHYTPQVSFSTNIEIL